MKQDGIELTKQVRQGDVLLLPAGALDKSPAARKLAINGKWHVIKRGETSGHAHVIDAEDIELWLDADGVAFLHVQNETMLKHVNELTGTPSPDHGALPVKPGWYQLPDQLEFTSGDFRAVAD